MCLCRTQVEHAEAGFNENLKIPMGPLGLTFVAAGTSFPGGMAASLANKRLAILPDKKPKSPKSQKSPKTAETIAETALSP